MPTLGGGAMGGGGEQAEVGKKRIDCDTEPHDTERLVQTRPKLKLYSSPTLPSLVLDIN